MSELIKIYNLLSEKEKKKAPLIFIFILLSTLFEILSISLIIPLMSIILEPNFLIENNIQVLEFVKNVFGASNLNYVLVTFFFIGILTKNIFLFFAIKKIYTFIFKNEKYISTKILHNYLSKPFSFFLNNNSSLLIHNVTQEVWKLNDMLLNAFYLVVEILIVSGIILLLIFSNIKTTLILLFSIISITFIFYNLYKKKLTFYGKQKQLYEGLRIKLLNEIFGSIKDVIIRDKQKEFLEKFKNNYDKVLQSRIYQSVTKALPKIWIELILVFSVSGILYFSLLTNLKLINHLPQIAFLAVCFIRLMPSFNRILYSIQLISFSKATIDLISKEASDQFTHKLSEDYKKELIQSISFNNNIVLKNLFFNYNENSPVLKNINITIKKNTLVAITGKSGSGKSTLINIILGLLKNQKGSIEVDNRDIHKEKLVKSWQRKLGYVPQSIFLNDDTIRKNIAFGIADDLIDEKKIDMSVKSSKVVEFLDNLPEKKNTIIGEKGSKLSGGQIQRIGIARALYNNPELLILDEATNALNSDIEDQIFKSLLDIKRFTTVIIVSHRETNLKYCDQILKIENGEIKELIS